MDDLTRDEYLTIYREMDLILRKIRMQAERLHSDGALPTTIAHSTIDATSAAMSALSWLALPTERVEVRLRKPEYKIGEYYRNQVSYIEPAAEETKE